jgi:3-phenylpropionate/cinnamic acid dioxygenase small subunit
MHVFTTNRFTSRIAVALAAGATLWLAGCAKSTTVQGPPPVAQATEPDSVARDRMAIEETLRLYVRALDESDLTAYLATLTDDAKFVSAEATHAGKDAIRNYVEPVMKSRLQRREKEGAAATATHHVVTNQAIEFLDRDNVVVRAYWMFVVAHGEKKPMTIDIMGSSEDFLRRVGDKWLIRERRVAP